MNKYEMVTFSIFLVVILSVSTPAVAQNQDEYLPYLYNCDTVPEAAPDGPWEVDTLDEGVDVISDGMVLYLNAYEEGGWALYYRNELSLADAEYYTMGANLFIARSLGFWITDFAFGAADGQREVFVMGALDYGGVFILTSTGWVDAEVDLSVPANYNLIVNRRNPDPSYHTVSLYRNKELVIQLPYAELTESTLDPPLFGFGTMDSDTVWEYVRYEVGGDPIASIDEVSTNIQTLPDDAFRDNPDQKKKALKQKLDETSKKIHEREYEDAIAKLQCDVRAKMDGNSPDDWIIDPAAQEELCEIIDKVCDYLGTL